MAKQTDPISRLYKRMLFGSGKVVLFFLFAGLVISAGFAGFAIDFTGCFGKSACSAEAGSYFLILPVLVLAAGVYGAYRWRQYQEKRHKDSVRSEVLQELGQPSSTRANSNEDKITQALYQYTNLSLDEILRYTGLDKEPALEAIRYLMRNRVIRQHIQDNKAYFTLSR